MSIGRLIRAIAGQVRCLFLRHQPNRRRVRKQAGGQHHGYCRFCGAPIRRRGFDDWIPAAWDKKDGDQAPG